MRFVDLRGMVLPLVIVTLGTLAAAPALAQKGGSRSEPRTLSGQVFAANDQPVQKAIVYLKNTKTLLIQTYITESDGSYRFTGIAPNVDYEIYAEREGLRSDTKTLSAFDNRKQPTVTLRLHSEGKSGK
jgi:protocatechuate 3,4-dioxygenase beta subunit